MDFGFRLRKVLVLTENPGGGKGVWEKVKFLPPLRWLLEGGRGG
ncbi:MAG: hypothetical protein QW835_07040 [Candidatus Hadarchaeum sp.]